MKWEGFSFSTFVFFVVSFNTLEEREREVFGDPLENIRKRCVFDLCGVNAFHRRMYRIIVTSTPEQRRKWLDEVARLCASVFPGHEAVL